MSWIKTSWQKQLLYVELLYQRYNKDYKENWSLWYTKYQTISEIKFTLKKKKKRRMRILDAHIFSKTFGGKIRAFWTANTYKLKKKNYGACVFF